MKQMMLDACVLHRITNTKKIHISIWSPFVIYIIIIIVYYYDLF